MSRAKESRLFALLFVFFLVATANANSTPDNNKLDRQQTIEVEPIAPDTNKPRTEPIGPKQAPNGAAIPSNRVFAAPLLPTAPDIETPPANKPSAVKPITSSWSDALTDLPASKRLAISALAGILTLIAALWIGARRD